MKQLIILKTINENPRSYIYAAFNKSQYRDCPSKLKNVFRFFEFKFFKY
jgi:hypothetical protein